MGRRRLAIVGVAVALALLGLASPAYASGGGYGGHHHDSAFVKIRDDCDPATFNAAFKAKVCEKQGHTTVDDFLAQFNATGAVKGWDFRPYVLHVRAGTKLHVRNVGGEFHTFTKVARFGGGCVPLLNAPKNKPALTPVKECRGVVFDPAKNQVPKVFGPTGVNAGQHKTFTVGRGRAHVERYECLIHPWMRSVVYVSASHASHHSYDY